MTTPRKSLNSPIVHVDITADVIATSTLRDSSHCMIADALQAALPKAKHISVDLATIRFSDPAAGQRYIYLTPRRAQEALLDFDQGRKPEPFKLRLAGAHVLPTGNARQARARLEDVRTSETQGTPPKRRGGKAPPVGPLPGGAPSRRDKPGANEGAGAGNNTGRRREFGLREFIR